MRPVWHWAAGGAMGAALALAGAPHRAPARLGERIARDLGDGAGAVTVVAVVQPADCAGRLASLDAVAHVARSTGAHFALAVLAPPPAEAPLAELSRARRWGAQVVSAPPSAARALRQLGVRHSPTVLVLDADRAIRWAEPLPETPAQLLRWRQLLPLVLAS